MTPRQSRFVSEYLKDLNATRAYGDVYGVNPKVAEANGSRLLRNAKVAERIAEAQFAATVRAELSLDGHLARLEKLSQAAEAAEQFSAAVSAEVSRGKAAGYYVTKSELSGSVGLFDKRQLADKLINVLESRQ